MSKRCTCRVDFLTSDVNPHYRIIELPYDAALGHLHEAIYQAFGLPDGAFSVFHQTNERGELGQAIPLAAMDPEGISADDFRIKDLLTPEHPYLAYIWDPLRNLQFFIQLQAIKDEADRQGVWVIEEQGPAIDLSKYTPKTGLSPEDEDLLKGLWRNE